MSRHATYNIVNIDHTLHVCLHYPTLTPPNHPQSIHIYGIPFSTLLHRQVTHLQMRLVFLRHLPQHVRIFGNALAVGDVLQPEARVSNGPKGHLGDEEWTLHAEEAVCQTPPELSSRSVWAGQFARKHVVIR